MLRVVNWEGIFAEKYDFFECGFHVGVFFDEFNGVFDVFVVACFGGN